MIVKGTWKGQYKYDNKIHKELTGFEATNFQIDIIDINDEQFTGRVSDDKATGGMDGVGEIVGKVIGDKIEFIKQMPVMRVMDTKGTRRTLSKKHPKIYYKGTFSDSASEISGVWRLKFNFVWIGIFPVPLMPSTGTWQMSLTEN
jgi:hypothetical protein